MATDTQNRIMAAPPLCRRSLPYRRYRRRRRGRASWRWAARRRRLLFLVAVGVQTVVATYYMRYVLPYHASTVVEMALVVTFALNFAWVSTGAWLAVYGWFYRLIGGDPRRLCRDVPPDARPRGRTALVMPIYHESVDACFAGLAATYRSIEEQGALDAFDFYVLSDSRDPDVWLAEQAAWDRWVDELGARGRLFYRRRRVNLRHKSGNVADFLRRWGSNYDYFVVLDADSIMDGATLLRMAAVMDAHPRAGIVQAPPRIVAAGSLFARLQQFANQLYGPLFSTGLAALQMGDGAYWGHNAIIRTRAFMQHCALPSLRGIGLFRGPILSHDFVEATYMRRGGYEVWLETDLAGSYEQSPPSLVDELERDRRWARGNLQHLPIMLGERGLGWVQRFIFLNGITAYVAAPLWLAFLILAGMEVAQFTWFPINYFPGGHRLFPLWPEWHPEWAIRLAASTAVVLFVPKCLALVDALSRAPLRRRFGGAWRVVVGTLMETLASVLLAPVRMLAHSRFVIEALLGVRLAWAGQHRSGDIGWGRALLMHGAGLVIGVAWLILAWHLRPLYFYWSLPVALPLVLAPAVAVLTSRGHPGDWFARHSLLLTPDARDVPPVVAMAQQVCPEDAADSDGTLAFILRRPRVLAVARVFARRNGRCPPQLLERALRHGVDSIEPRQRVQIADDADALDFLYRRHRRAA